MLTKIFVEWADKSETLAVGRAFHSMVAIKDKAFTFGGNNISKFSTVVTIPKRLACLLAVLKEVFGYFIINTLKMVPTAAQSDTCHYYCEKGLYPNTIKRVLFMSHNKRFIGDNLFS